jgi:nucleotide-binding universal stress UspA family protein
MSRVIALIDGSIYSQSVCDHAAWAALRIGAPVELVHVIGRGADARHDHSGAIGFGARTALLEELVELDAQHAKLALKQGRAILDDAKTRVEAAGVTRLRHGDVVETVQELESDARVVILGKRGASADFAKGHLGSNLERVARSCTKPVLVAARAFTVPERCLIAFDGGASSLKAVDMAAQSPFFAGMEIHVLMVGSASAETRHKLDGAVGTAYVGREKIGLLVMGAYGHSRIRTMIIGSTTTEMVRSCKVPVLLFR